MASSFIDTFQNLADSISSNKNGFTWDSAIRKFQYGVAGITLAALSIFETTNSMQCSTPTPSFPEYYYASSYCQEATWYYVNNATGGREPYDEFLRYFKWYILIPPVLTILLAVLYGALVDSFIVQALKSASKIMNIWNAGIEDSSTIEGTTAINNTMLNMAICARVFSETNMHYKKNNKWYSCAGTSRSPKKPKLDYSATDGDNTELFQVDHSVLIEQAKEEVATAGKLGQSTAMYFNIYLAFVFIINVIACVFLNPYYFWFPNAIACRYRKEDLTFHWSICSVPGHRYSRVAVIIVLMCHFVGAFVTLLSFYYLNCFIPRQILSANIAISSYTRQPKQQEKLLQCWLKYGRRKIKNLTATTKFILALIYQNIDKSLCYRLVLALIDIEKDNDAIEWDLPNLIKDIVAMDLNDPSVFNDDKEEKIDEIRETILNPVGIDQVRDNIQSRILVKLIGAFLDNPNSTNELLEAQQIQRITGVQLPKLSRAIKEKFVNLIREKKRSDFDSSQEYFNFIGALYDLSKSKTFFSVLQTIEIGHVTDDDEYIGSITDNGHETVGGHEFDAKRAFDSSGYCWRSSDVTSYNWIRRSWDEPYNISLIAIQGSHVNEKSTPIRFNFTAKLKDSTTGKESWVEVSETYRSYDWMKDEWRVFSVLNNENHTNAIQMNIFNNGGASFFEIQKIKIYGTQ